MSARRREIAHNCREHILVQHGPNGASPKWRCSVCRKPVRMTMRPNQVLARAAS